MKETRIQYPVMLFKARTMLCALSTAHVLEIMRPLPVQAVAAAPAFVSGVALIRGVAVPVVDAGTLLGEPGAAGITRFIALRIGERSVALAVEAVLGIRQLPQASLQQLPPLLADTGSDVLSALGRLDSALLTVLQLGRTLTEPALQALEMDGVPA
jgi:purine-binding chemotaxis protein CheW